MDKEENCFLENQQTEKEEGAQPVGTPVNALNLATDKARAVRCDAITKPKTQHRWTFIHSFIPVVNREHPARDTVLTQLSRLHRGRFLLASLGKHIWEPVPACKNTSNQCFKDPNSSQIVGITKDTKVKEGPNPERGVSINSDLSMLP